MSEETAKADTPKTDAPATGKRAAAAKAADPVKETVEPTPEPKEEPTPTPQDAQSEEPQPAQQAPSVGRMVHYQLTSGSPVLAAVITAVHEDAEEGVVSLVIFREHLQMFRRNVVFDPKGKAGTWRWPEKV